MKFLERLYDKKVHHHWFEVFHHFLAASLLATLTLALEYAGALHWLDAAMLRMIHAENTTHSPHASATQTRLLTVLIDKASYAGYFHLQSPLPREQLMPVLQDIFAAKPRAVLIDLQLEPAWGDSTDRPIDMLLKQTSATDRMERTAVLLPIPTPRTEELDAVSLHWMRDMCAAGIAFGSARIREHFGAAVRFDKIPQALSVMLLEHGSKTNENSSHTGMDSTLSNTSPACELALVTPSIKVLHAAIQPARMALEDTAPLSPVSVATAKQAHLIWTPVETRETLRVLRPDWVVLGGAYDQNDKFHVFGDPNPIPGAILHAAIASSWDKVKTSHRWAWVIDVFFGTLLGLLFHWIWKHLPKESQPKKALTCRQLLSVNFKNLTVWTLAAVWVLALSWAILKASNSLIEEGYWMNPGPVVLGMLIHALLLSSDTGEHKHPNSLKAFFIQHPGCALPASLALMSLVSLPFVH